MHPYIAQRATHTSPACAQEGTRIKPFPQMKYLRLPHLIFKNSPLAGLGLKGRSREGLTPCQHLLVLRALSRRCYTDSARLHRPPGAAPRPPEPPALPERSRLPEMLRCSLPTTPRSRSPPSPAEAPRGRTPALPRPVPSGTWAPGRSPPPAPGPPRPRPRGAPGSPPGD